MVHVSDNHVQQSMRRCKFAGKLAALFLEEYQWIDIIYPWRAHLVRVWGAYRCCVVSLQVFPVIAVSYLKLIHSLLM